MPGNLQQPSVAAVEKIVARSGDCNSPAQIHEDNSRSPAAPLATGSGTTGRKSAIGLLRRLLQLARDGQKHRLKRILSFEDEIRAVGEGERLDRHLMLHKVQLHGLVSSEETQSSAAALSGSVIGFSRELTAGSGELPQ